MNSSDVYNPHVSFRAFHGDNNLKRKFLELARQHREQDAVVQGTYGVLDGTRFHGCAVGCTLESYRRITGLKEVGYGRHELYEKAIGVPEILAHLEDRIFEGLSPDDAKAWPERFLSSIPVGSDLSLVWPRFAIWLMTEVRRFTDKRAIQKHIGSVKKLYTRVVKGDEVGQGEFSAAYAAAADDAAAAAADDAYAASAAAAAAAADDDAYAASAAAADAAADDAYAASAAAAAAAADAAAYLKAKQYFFKKESDKLAEIMLACFPLHPIAVELSVVCSMDFEANKGLLFRESKLLSVASPTPTPELIHANYNGSGYWTEQDWRGKKGQRPTPAQVRQTWGRWERENDVQPATRFDGIIEYIQERE